MYNIWMFVCVFYMSIVYSNFLYYNECIVLYSHLNCVLTCFSLHVLYYMYVLLCTHCI